MTNLPTALFRFVWDRQDPGVALKNGQHVTIADMDGRYFLGTYRAMQPMREFLEVKVTWENGVAQEVTGVNEEETKDLKDFSKYLFAQMALRNQKIVEGIMNNPA